MASDPQREIEANRKILAMLDNAIEEIKEIKPFGFFAKQLMGLRRRFGKSLKVAAKEAATTSTAPDQIRMPQCADDEKIVYFRLFHRDMNRLDAKRPQALPWLKTLLEGIYTCEKRGIAVYGSEDEARRSTRNKNYCYVGVKIKNSDDVTAKRSPKTCAILGCPLLVIADTNAIELFKLHYNGLNFPIVRGDVQPPLSKEKVT